MTALFAMAGLALASWVMRVFFIVLVPAERLPQGLRDALAHLAPAVLAALVTVEVAGAVNDLDSARAALLIGSVLLAGIAVRLTGSLGLAVGVGAVAAVLLDVVLV